MKKREMINAVNKPVGYLIKDSKNGDMFLPEADYRCFKNTINARKKEFKIKKVRLTGIEIEDY